MNLGIQTMNNKNLVKQYNRFQLEDEKQKQNVIHFKECYDFTNKFYAQNQTEAKNYSSKLSLCVNLKILEQYTQHQKNGDLCLQAIGMGISNLHKIEKLFLSFKFCWLQPDLKIDDFIKGILSNKDSLKYLKLDFSNNRIELQLPKKIISTVSQCLNLIELTLVFHQLDLKKGFAENFGELRNLQKLKRLSINLSSNEVHSIKEDLLFIASQLPFLHFIEYFDISLAKNHLTEGEVKFILEGISQMKSLVSLQLNLSENILGEQGAEHIGNNLQKLQNLEELVLELGWTKICNYQSWTSLFQNLVKCQALKSLTLDLKWNYLEEKWIQEIQFLEKKQLKIEGLTLLLRGNQLKTEGLLKVVRYFSNITSLQRISIQSENNEVNSNLDILGDLLCSFKVQKFQLKLDDNEIDNVELNQFLKSFCQNNSIEDLDLHLGGNKYDLNCYGNIGLQLSHLKQLHTLSFQSNFQKYNPSEFKYAQEMFNNLLKSKSLCFFNFSQFIPQEFHEQFQDCVKECRKSNYLVQFQLNI